MFNQEPAEEPGAISQTVQDETEGNTIQDNSYLKTQNSLPTEEEFINLNDVRVTVKSGPLLRSLSEPCSQREVQTVGCACRPEGFGRTVHRSCCSELGLHAALQVDNGSEGDDSFLQREGSQRRSRRRFRRINPRGERELITDGQEPSGYTKVRVKCWPSQFIVQVLLYSFKSQNMKSVTNTCFDKLWQLRAQLEGFPVNFLNYYCCYVI